MKTLFSLSNLTLLLLAVSFSAIQAQSIPEVLYYRFDRNDNIVINDANGATAQTDTAYILGALTQDSIGQCGNALVGSGNISSTDYVNTGWVPNLAGGSWTISFWTNNIQPTTTLYYVFGDLNTSTFRCFTNGVAGTGNWMLRGAGLVDILATGGATAGPAMTTFTYNSATAISKAYVNGIPIDTVIQTAPFLSGTGPFTVGGYDANIGLPDGGLMDEFRLYNRALSDAEILELFDLSTSSNTVLTVCDSMVSPSGMHTWTSTGIYNDTILNMAGCDSILTIDLTILSVDNSVSINGITLTANSLTGTFQWVDCNDGYSHISGETNQSFTPTANGSYAVIISDVCTDTSLCFDINNVGIDVAQMENSQVFPNPNSGQFVIKSSKIPDLISVSDLIGNEIIQIIPMDFATDVSLDGFSAGVYYVHVSSNNITQHIKIVVTQ